MTRLVRPALALILLGPLAAIAQEKQDADNREDAKAKAVEAVKPWLSVMDQGRYGDGWESGSAQGKHNQPKDDFVKAIAHIRTPLGKLISRTVLVVRYSGTLDGSPDGQYVTIMYVAVYEKKKVVPEVLILTAEKDGTWKVVSYHVDEPEKVNPDEAVKKATESAEVFLALTDQGKFGEAWEQMAGMLRTSQSKDAFAKATDRLRKPFGKMASRKIGIAHYRPNSAGADGVKCVIFWFDTMFEKDTPVVEKVAVLLEPDGTWKVVGYRFE